MEALFVLKDRILGIPRIDWMGERGKLPLELIEEGADLQERYWEGSGSYKGSLQTVENNFD